MDNNICLLPLPQQDILCVCVCVGGGSALPEKIVGKRNLGDFMNFQLIFSR